MFKEKELQPIVSRNLSEANKYIAYAYDLGTYFRKRKEINITIEKIYTPRIGAKFYVWDVYINQQSMRMIRKIYKKNAAYHFYKRDTNDKMCYYKSAKHLYTKDSIIHLSYDVCNIINEMCAMKI